jgi:hypothetical protein
MLLAATVYKSRNPDPLKHSTRKIPKKTTKKIQKNSLVKEMDMGLGRVTFQTVAVRNTNGIPGEKMRRIAQEYN